MGRFLNLRIGHCLDLLGMVPVKARLKSKTPMGTKHTGLMDQKEEMGWLEGMIAWVEMSLRPAC